MRVQGRSRRRVAVFAFFALRLSAPPSYALLRRKYLLSYHRIHEDGGSPVCLTVGREHRQSRSFLVPWPSRNKKVPPATDRRVRREVHPNPDRRWHRVTRKF